VLPAQVKVHAVDEATLATVRGKYFGANMLVGVRIDLVSSLTTPQHGTASAAGALMVRNTGGGFQVQVDTRSSAQSAVEAGASLASQGLASGGESLQINGIGQVTQIAGDGNRMRNITAIRFVSDLGGGDFNGQAASQTSAGPMTAQVTFLDGGAQLTLSGPGALLGQQFSAGGGGNRRILQIGQIVGNGIAGSNQIQLQLLTQAMTARMQHYLGIQQALSGLQGLPR
jgi:hypothetical protein